MTVAAVLVGLGLLVVLLAWYNDMARDRPGPRAPSWGVLPAPGDITRVEFPLAMAGYDPASVELHLDSLARAYIDLYEAAPDDVRLAAHQRAAFRLGVDDELLLPGVGVPLMATALGGPRAGSDADALRTEVALADLDFSHRERVLDLSGELDSPPPPPPLESVAEDEVADSSPGADDEAGDEVAAADDEPGDEVAVTDDEPASAGPEEAADTDDAVESQDEADEEAASPEPADAPDGSDAEAEEPAPPAIDGSATGEDQANAPPAKPPRGKRGRGRR